MLDRRTFLKAAAVAALPAAIVNQAQATVVEPEPHLWYGDMEPPKFGLNHRWCRHEDRHKVANHLMRHGVRLDSWGGKHARPVAVAIVDVVLNVGKSKHLAARIDYLIQEPFL